MLILLKNKIGVPIIFRILFSYLLLLVVNELNDFVLGNDELYFEEVVEFWLVSYLWLSQERI